MFESHISIIVELCLSFVLCLLILLYYSRKKMNVVIFITSLICWILNLFLIILIPYDVYYTQTEHKKIPEEMQSFLNNGYKISYWSLFILTWFIIPIMKEYECSGEFTVYEKLKISFKKNIKFFIILGIICIIAAIYCLFKFGFDSTFLIIQNFSLIFGLFFFYFLLSYGLIKYPKTLYLKFKSQIQITYLEWKANNFIEKLSELKSELINDYSKLKSTNDSYKDKKNEKKLSENNDDIEDNFNREENVLNDENINKKKQKEEKYIEDYLKYIEQKLSEFYEEAYIYGIDIKKEKLEGKNPIKEYNELIEINKKINMNQTDCLRIQSRLRNCYMRWAKLKTSVYLTESINDNTDYNNIDNAIIIIQDDNEINSDEKEKNKDGFLEIEKSHFIPLEDFSQCKIFYYSKIKKYMYLVLLILSIIASIFTILWELFIIGGFSFLHIYKNVDNIVAIHLIILIPLIYLIGMSNYTLFKIKLSSYLFMYGPRQTDSVSLIIFTSYLSRIYFAICINYIQAINNFSGRKYRTIFETFFGLEHDIGNENFIYSYCQYSPIILYTFMILFYFNIPGKIGACFGYNLFEFDSEERTIGIENGHNYLMKLNKKLNGKKLEYYESKIFEDI